MNDMISFVKSITPEHMALDIYLRNIVHDIQHHASNSTITDNNSDVSNTSFLKQLWSTILTVILITFILSCTQQFAQYYVYVLDTKKSEILREKIKKEVKEKLISPSSGILRLPLSTAKKNRKLQLLANKMISSNVRNGLCDGITDIKRVDVIHGDEKIITTSNSSSNCCSLTPRNLKIDNESQDHMQEDKNNVEVHTPVVYSPNPSAMGYYYLIIYNSIIIPTYSCTYLPINLFCI
jgi:hypothetical protein